MTPVPPKQRLLTRQAKRNLAAWKPIQAVSMFSGVILFLLLLFRPKAGLLIFWNILIPVAPALLVLAAGLWRNICPMAIFTLLPRHLDRSRKKVMPMAWQSRLQVAAIALLYIIVPLRHPVFNENGPATAILLGTASLTGLTMGFLFDWKTAWCASLCPIHPVEKLYGSKTARTFVNAHCTECVNCSLPCPDSTPGMHPQLARKNRFQEWSGVLTVGGLPGFIWGWFQVPDQKFTGKINAVLSAYPLPFIGLVCSLGICLVVRKIFFRHNERLLVPVFAAAAVSCYYWFRIPELVGFGQFGSDGMLFSLSQEIPSWTVDLFRIAIISFLCWWLMIRRDPKRSWLVRPPYQAGLRTNRLQQKSMQMHR